jgi:hypothetical protein
VAAARKRSAERARAASAEGAGRVSRRTLDAATCESRSRWKEWATARVDLPSTRPGTWQLSPASGAQAQAARDTILVDHSALRKRWHAS